MMTTRGMGGVSAAALLHAALLHAVLAAAPAAGQAAPAIGGMEVRGGITFPEQATAALTVMVEGDVGYFWRPQLRLLAGASHFRANIDREPGDNEGSFAATGLWAGARYDLLPWQPWGAYAKGAVTVHRVDADAWDPAIGALLSGTNLGVAVAAGTRYSIDARGRLHGTLEVRRTLLNNLNQTTVEVGVRFLRRGAYAWVPDAVALAPRTAPVRPPVAPPAAQAGAATPPAAAVAVPDADDPRTRAEAAARAAEAARAAGAARAAEELEAERLRAAAAAERVAAEAARIRQALERAAAVMPSVSSVRETPDAWVVTLGGGAFASGAAELTAAARSELRALANVLAGYPGHLILAEGHADAQGDAAANRRLSAERAGAVRAGLIVEGVDALWTASRGMGDSRPVADNATAAGRALNRRVEISVSRLPCPRPPLPAADGSLACPAQALPDR
jgi:outer membrane protein OmpA-like peptidoglycan-associated protein